MTIRRAVLRRAKAAIKRAAGPLIRGSGTSAPAPAPEYWGLRRSIDGKLSLDGLELESLGREWGFPLHIINAARLRDNARRFLAVPAGQPAGCEVFYSYKTNPIPGVLRELHAAGLGAEVISHYELWLARELGVPPERIVFNGPGKSEEAIREAVAAGIQIINCNHREEIAVVARVAERLGRRPRVGIRVTVGEGWSGQFGVAAPGGLALDAYREALASPHLDVVGLHVHRGGMIRSRAEAEGFVDAVLAFANELHARLGLTLEIINFGGSLATPTVDHLSARDLRLNRTFKRDLPPVDPATAMPIEEYTSTVVRKVAGFHASRGRPRPRIFLEPGRSVTGDAQMLLASVMSIKDEHGSSFAILNAGINLAESCRSEYHRLLPAGPPRGPERTYTVVGPICTPGDTLYWAARLPELSPGDPLVIMDAGAYFVPFSTAFSYPRPAIVMVDGGSVRQIRRAEAFADVISCDG